MLLFTGLLSGSYLASQLSYTVQSHLLRNLDTIEGQSLTYQLAIRKYPHLHSHRQIGWRCSFSCEPCSQCVKSTTAANFNRHENTSQFCRDRRPQKALLCQLMLLMLSLPVTFSDLKYAKNYVADLEQALDFSEYYFLYLFSGK